jgi:hypothetical protein
MNTVSKILGSIAICAFGITLLYLVINETKPEVFTRYEVITLPGDTFDLDVKVIVTEDVAFAAKYVQENLDSTVTTKDFDARAVSFNTVDGKSPIVWMATVDDHGIIAHEIFHTTLNIMYWTGMELNSETEEAFAYEVQHLTNSFYNQIKPKK